MIFEGRNLPPTVMQHCVDAATDKLMNANFWRREVVLAKGLLETGHEGASRRHALTIDSVCKFGEMTTTSHAVVTGSFDSAYTMKVASTRQGGPSLPGVVPGAETHMTIEAKWWAPAPRGKSPGDVIMINGMPMRRAFDMQRMRGAPIQ